MYILQNDKLKIAVKKTGAELCKITSTKNNTEFMWNANPDIWEGYSPNLFPIVGALKENTFIFENEEYKLCKHGFVIQNENIILHEQTENSLTFKLVYNEASLKVYPFKFEFFVRYFLTDNTIKVSYTIKNIDSKTIYFSVGGHPAFKCPIFDNENYEDYCLKFEHYENSKTHLVNLDNGLITSGTEAVFNTSNKIQLTHNLFHRDALVFKDLKSKKITLNSANYGNILTISYHDFDYLGIWAKTTGNYVCIEPWLGTPDGETTNQNLKEKEGIISLAKNKSFKATYSIEIHNSHLV